MKKQSLSSKQIRYLRGLGHHLTPVAMVGQQGLTESVVKSVQDVLTAHELIKIKVQNGAGLDRHEAAEELSRLTGAALVQVLGRTVLLFRENRDLRVDKRIILP